MKHLLTVISGPSGVGKGTIVKELLKKGGFSLSVSCTTRPPRPGESDGKEYFFISKDKFLEMVENGGFLEYSNHFGNYYGTPKAFVEEKLKTHDVLLEIEVDGALNVKRVHPDALLIMIVPPGVEELKSRLKKRGTEDEEKIANRIKRMEYELSKSGSYDYTVVNDDLTCAVAEVEEIINKTKLGA